MYKFVSKSFNEILYDKVISSMYPSLSINDKLLLQKYLEKTIDFMAYSFGFMEKKNEFEKQLSQQNYRDAKGVLNMLLIFINDNEKDNLKSLSQLYLEKHESVDINKKSPKYVFSNIQYGRCIRDKKITEIEFNIEHLEQNYLLLLDTIKSISNKLYINWLNIVPVDKNDDYIKKSKKWFDEGIINEVNVIDYDKAEDTKNYIEDLSHIQVDDIYNVLTNDYYYTIKNFKWLIYEIKYNDNYYPVILFLSNIFPYAFKTDVYDTAEYKETTENILNNIVDCVNNEKEFIISNEVVATKLEASEIKKIYIALIVFFNNKYERIEELVNKNKYKKIEVNENDDDDIDIYNSKINIKKINASYNSLKDKDHLVKFIQLQCVEFFLNPISKYIDHCLSYRTLPVEFNYKNVFDAYDKFINHFYDNVFTGVGEMSINSEDISTKKYKFGYIREKHVYNFCKSLCHETIDNKFTSLPRFWKSLNTKQKKEICQRLSLKNKNDNWFNISRYLVNLRNINKDHAKEISNNISKIIKKNIIPYVFNSLYCKGTLSRFEFNLEVDDINTKNKEIREKNNRILKKYFEKNEEKYEKAYYYLTNKKYSLMKMYHMDKNKKELIFDNNGVNMYEKEITYLKYATTVTWVPYAMDWISQINFFHRYLNNRIIYVTGSTGVGKSTEVPKLFLYALKAIDHKNDGYAVCTQPRRGPVTKNTETMANALGVPILKTKIEMKKEIEDEKKSVDSLDDEIKIKTDEEKTFKFNMDNQNLIFKHGGENNISKETNYGLRLKLVTDALLDIDLTNSVLLKKNYKKKIERNGKEEEVLYFKKKNVYDIIMVDEAHEHNTFMDLILTVAKYAVMFNNDLKLVIISATMDDDEPVYRRYYRDINDNLMFPLSTFIKENNLDRVNVDRRLHISPPGQTTNFLINESYHPDKKGSEDDLVIEVEKITEGDMLYFRPGLGDIKKSIEYLNKNLPDNVIAIPFYSQLYDPKKELVLDIGKRKNEIKMDRNKDFGLEDFSIGNNSYNRVVIVATNIAEASITIDTLKVVIETGTQKTNVFNFEKKISVLKEDTISESSRLQRKGRVGRVGPGKVFYIYKKGAMEKNKIKFGISREDISDKIYAKLYDNKYGNSEILLSNDNNPNNQKINWKNIDKIYRSDIKDIIEEQYFLNGSFYGYYGNKEHYDYSNMSTIYDCYEDGFNIETLNDKECKFYIIHPEELFLNRNIIGTPISIEETDEAIMKDEKIISYKIDSFWDVKFDSLDLIKVGEKIGFNQDYDYKVKKTEHGEMISKLFSKMEMKLDDSYLLFKCLIYGYAFNCSENMIRYISFHETMKNKFEGKYTSLFNSIIVKDKVKPDMNFITGYLGESKSEITGYLKILSEFFSFIKKHDIEFNFDMKKKEFEYLLLNIQDDINNKTKIIKIEKVISIFDEDDEITFKEEKNKRDYIEAITLIHMDYIKNISDKILIWAYKRNINIEVIYEYIRNYIHLNCKLVIAKKDDAYANNFTDIIEKMRNICPTITNESEEGRIISCLILSYPYNIVRKIENINYYISLYNPSPIGSKLNIYNNKISEAIISNNYIYGYLLYLNINAETEKMDILTCIPEKLLYIVSHIYYLSKMQNIYTNYLYSLKENKYKKNNTETENKLLTNYNRTLKIMLNDLKLYYDNNCWLNIANISEEISDYALIKRYKNLKF